MSTTTASTTDLHHVRVGQGPDVVLIAGLTDPLESWQFQLDGLSDRFTLTAFDNRGAGRSPLPADGPLTVAGMADDTAALMRSLGIERAHVAGFSGGGAVAQELALRHPELVRSLLINGSFCRQNELTRRVLSSLKWLARVAPSEREFLELFLAWIYTPSAYESGWVDAVIDEALAFEHPQTYEGLCAQIDAWSVFDSRDRLHAITAPTLVRTGELDLLVPPSSGREIADRIPGAVFEVMPGAAHQPFQEDPESWNARAAEWWQSV
jgi:pimeloyl-ACP methyl ester carboxylesterase